MIFHVLRWIVDLFRWSRPNLPRRRCPPLPVVLLCLAALAGPARAADVTIYTATGPGIPHTFALFRDTGSEVCISWLPTQARRGLVAPTAGTNLGFAETLERAAAAGQHIVNHGTIPISYAMFDRAVDQVSRLKAGAVTYQVVPRCNGSLNCCLAVGEIFDVRFLPCCGEAAATVIISRAKGYTP